jgi:hypothetical protein
VLQRSTKAVMVLALACSIGLHWELVQSVAWVRMLVSYSQDAPLTEALAKTFDGKHPCALCKQIAKGKQSEKTSDLRPDRAKYEFSYTATKFVFNAPNRFRKLPIAQLASRLLNEAPPVPPPRLNLA